MQKLSPQESIRQRIYEEALRIAPLLEKLPAVAIIHDIRDGSVIYMCSKGLDLLGATIEELQAMGIDYYPRFFNIEQVSEYLPHMLELVRRNDPCEVFTFFQQVRIKGYPDWQWHLSSIRIFMQDDVGQPAAVITLAHHITPDNHYTRKVERMLEELTFLREKAAVFATLGRREHEVLQMMAQGKSAPEIAEALFISPLTAETHRKNIRRKLNIQHPQDIDRFARAFNLI